MALVVLLFGACGGGETGRSPALSTLRLPLINDPILNPVTAPDLGSVLINKVIFPGLVRPDEKLHPAPDLARSWEVSDEGRVYTFALRPGVKWHDGRPFGASDVKFTFDRIVDSTSGSRLRSDFAALSKVEVVDSLTVRFTLRAPFAPFLALLGYNAGILPEHLLRGKRLSDATDFGRTHPVGTGPFEVSRVVPGVSVTLVRNPDYYGDRPKLEGMLFKIVPDINAQVSQLRAGELDIITIEPSNLASVQGSDNLRVRQVGVVQHFYVGFNQRNPLFKPPLIRRAMAHAVNREAIIAGVLKGYADYPQGTIPVALGEFFADTLPRIGYDTTAARRLLAQAGWTPGADGLLRNAAGQRFAFTLLVDKGNPSREQTALAVQQDLKRLGMDVTLRTLEFATVVRDFVLPGKFDANLIWWTTPPDPDQYAFYATGQDNNNVAYANATADRLLLAGRQTTDSARRRAIYHAFQAVEAEDPPVLVLYYPREIQAVSARLGGMKELGVRDAMRWSEGLYFEPR